MRIVRKGNIAVVVKVDVDGDEKCNLHKQGHVIIRPSGGGGGVFFI